MITCRQCKFELDLTAFRKRKYTRANGEETFQFERTCLSCQAENKRNRTTRTRKEREQRDTGPSNGPEHTFFCTMRPTR